MQTYVTLLNWTETGIGSFKGAPERTKEAAALLEKMGGRLKDVYWTLGPYDVVSVIEAPDDETLMAFQLAIGSKGNVRSTTLRALNADEFQSVVDKAP
jgi:uncharacterized protein with GYD domain